MKSKKRFFILMAVAEIVIIILIGMHSMSFLTMNNSTSNSNAIAKELMVQTYSYDVWSMNRNTDYPGLADGIYCGSLRWDDSISDVFEYDGSSEDINLFLRNMFRTPAYNAGYYCIVINGGKISQTYWGKSESVIDNAVPLAYSVLSGNAYNDSYIGRDVIGGYPVMCNLSHELSLEENVNVTLPLYISSNLSNFRARDIIDAVEWYWIYLVPLPLICIVVFLKDLIVHRKNAKEVSYAYPEASQSKDT